MTRRLLRLAVVAAALAGVAGRAAAQNVQLFPYDSYYYGADTVFHVPTGQMKRLRLYGSVPGGGSAYNISVFVDTARLRIVDADSVPGYGWAKPVITRNAADRITLSGAVTPGSIGGGYLADLWVQAAPGATSGSLFSLRVNSWTNQAGAPVDVRTLQTDIENGCIAYALWGDPDSSLTVTGRDALIALTRAVGLPVSGFNLALADVDDDLVVTSRDALLMLGYAIDPQYYYYDYYRTGAPIAGSCAPLAGVPSDFAFMQGTAAGNLYRVPAGDTIAVSVGSQTAFYTNPPVRWSPDGTKILATALTSAWYYDPVALTVATGVEDTLARGNYVFDAGGAYSPDGASIAFYSNRTSFELYLMNADGSNQFQAQTSVNVTSFTAQAPAWSPDGQRVAFPGYQTGAPTGTTPGLWSVGDGGVVRLEFPISASYPPLDPVWSPAGDSILFRASNNRLYAVAAPDTATVPIPAVSLSGTLRYPSWTSAGVLFRRDQNTSQPATYDYYLRRPDGRILRVYRATSTDAVGGHFR